MNRILIVEDEKPASERLSKLLCEIDPNAKICGFTDSLSSTVKWLQTNEHPDLIMLDIQLGDGLSFDLFKSVQPKSYIIFTTAYDEYALKAFKFNSVDYLLKPIKKDELETAYLKFCQRKNNEQHVSLEMIIQIMENKSTQWKNRFVINIGTKLISVDTKNIACFYTLEKSTYLHTFDGKNYPLDFSLDAIERIVAPSVYFRISRQQIINYDAIKTIHVLSKSRIKIDLNINIEEDSYVSFGKSHDFRTWLDR